MKIHGQGRQHIYQHGTLLNQSEKALCPCKDVLFSLTCTTRLNTVGHRICVLRIFDLLHTRATTADRQHLNSNSSVNARIAVSMTFERRQMCVVHISYPTDPKRRLNGGANDARTAAVKRLLATNVVKCNCFKPNPHR